MCYCPSLLRYLVFADVIFLENASFLSKMEAPIVKDGGSNYQRWRLQIWRLKIVKNLATNPPFFIPC